MHLREILVEARFLRVECREVEDRFMGIQNPEAAGVYGFRQQNHKIPGEDCSQAVQTTASQVSQTHLKPKLKTASSFASSNPSDNS